MEPYNPLEKSNLASSVAGALLHRPHEPLGALDRFPGAGVYLLYYSGAFPAYREAVSEGRPVYVGKAEVKGRRSGLGGRDAPPGTELFDRLRQHARSIQQVDNLDLAEFICQFLVVDEIWIPLAESLLIQRSQPLWNQAIPGFGIHAPGRGRGNQQRSVWDTLHPGRLFARKLPPNENEEHILHRYTSGLPGRESDSTE